MGRKLADYTKNELGVDKIVVFYTPYSSYSASLQEAFEDYFEQLGGEVINKTDLGAPNLDLESEVEALQDKASAIALFPDTKLTSVAIALARTNLEQSRRNFLC